MNIFFCQYNKRFLWTPFSIGFSNLTHLSTNHLMPKQLEPQKYWSFWRSTVQKTSSLKRELPTDNSAKVDNKKSSSSSQDTSWLNKLKSTALKKLSSTDNMRSWHCHSSSFQKLEANSFMNSFTQKSLVFLRLVTPALWSRPLASPSTESQCVSLYRIEHALQRKYSSGKTYWNKLFHLVLRIN